MRGKIKIPTSRITSLYYLVNRKEKDGTDKREDTLD